MGVQGIAIAIGTSGPAAMIPAHAAAAACCREAWSRLQSHRVTACHAQGLVLPQLPWAARQSWS